MRAQARRAIPRRRHHLVCRRPPQPPEPREPDLPPRSSGAATSRACWSTCTPGQAHLPREHDPIRGTTREYALSAARRGSGLTAGTDFHLAFSPDGSTRAHRLHHRDDAQGPSRPHPGLHREGARGLRKAIDALVPVTTPEVAEMTSCSRTSSAAVNIALVNELAMLCDRLGIDIWEVIEAPPAASAS